MSPPEAIDAIHPGELPSDMESDMQACRALLTPASPDTARLGGLKSAVDTDQAGERGFVAFLRSLKTNHRILLITATVVFVTLLALVTTPRVDLAHYPTGRMGIALGALGLVTATAVWRLLRPLHRPALNVWGSRALTAIGVVIPLALAFVPMEHVGVAPGHGLSFAAACGKCIGFGGVLGAPVLALAYWARRKSVDGAAVAALGGVAAGLTGNLTLQVHCPITDPAHLVFGHLLLLGLLIAGAATWKG